MVTGPLRAVLFDFDHTITDFGHHVRWAEARGAVRTVYEGAGVPAPFLDEHPGSLSLYIAVGERRPIDGNALVEAQRRASAILDQFEAEAISATEPLPGAHDLVEALPALGVRSGIVTSNASSVARRILERLRLAAPFEVVLGRSEVRLLKPSPEGLSAACAELAVPPAEAAYVGDSESDMRAAIAGGLHPWGVSTGLGEANALRSAGAETVFATLTEVVAQLRELHAMTARGT